MVVCRRVFNLNEIATWFDRLTMSGCAPRNDKVGTREADGTVDTFARYNARIMWHGNSKEVVAVNMGSEPILGMQLLQGSNLSVDAVFGGSVTITELPGQPSGQPRSDGRVDGAKDENDGKMGE